MIGPLAREEASRSSPGLKPFCTSVRLALPDEWRNEWIASLLQSGVSRMPPPPAPRRLRPPRSALAAFAGKSGCCAPGPFCPHVVVFLPPGWRWRLQRGWVGGRQAGRESKPMRVLHPAAAAPNRPPACAPQRGLSPGSRSHPCLLADRWQTVTDGGSFDALVYY